MFEELFLLLELTPVNRVTDHPYCAEITQSFTTLLQQNDQYKVDLAKSDGYARLCIAILDNESPLTSETFDALFGMLVDSTTWETVPQRITNKYVIAVLMDLFSIMDCKLQLLLIDRMILLASACDINSWALCNSSIISKLLRSPIPNEVSYDYVTKTMALFEILGSYSVTISDVKLLLSSLCFDQADEQSLSDDQVSCAQVVPSTYLASHHSSLLETLYEISRHNNDSSFFQFKGKGSGIQVHHLRFPNSGYSFFTWVKLDSSNSKDKRQLQNLLSFSDQDGTIFEAYFDQGTLKFDLKISGKEETVVTRYKFSFGRWYFITIIHSSLTFNWGFGHSELLVYVDGDLCSRTQLEYPSFNNTTFRALIGASPVRNCQRFDPGYKIEAEYLTNSFYGQLSTLYLVQGAITSKQIAAVYQLGKEHASIFSSNETRGVQTASSSAAILPPELNQGFKVIFTFHVRASSSSLCYNLHSFQTSSVVKSDFRTQLHATLSRIEKCSTLSLQNALYALGGIENLFPLLLKLDTVETVSEPRSPLDLQTNFFIRKGHAPAFFALVGSLIENHQENQHSFLASNGVQIIAYLLKQAHPMHLSVSTYQSMVALSNIISDNKPLYSQVQLHLLFNMRLWMYSTFETQAYILDLIKNMIDSRRSYYRAEFNVPFFFDLLRMCYYYEPDTYSMSSKHDTFNVSRPSHSSELFQLRSIILDIIQGYLKDETTPEGAIALSRHLLVSQDHQHSVEILNMILDFFQSDLEASLLKHFLFFKGYETLCSLLERPNNSLRALVYEMLTFFITHPKIPERWKIRMQETDMHTSIFVRSCRMAIDTKVYMSMLEFCLDTPISSPRSSSNVGVSALLGNADITRLNIRNPAFFVTLLRLISVSGTSESLKELILSDLIKLCSHSLKLCHQLQSQDGFLVALIPLLPIPQDRGNSLKEKVDGLAPDQTGMPRSCRLIIELLCTMAVNTLGANPRYALGSNFVKEVLYHWWSTSTIYCRQSGVTFHRDHFRGTDLRMSPPEVWPHASTLSLIRQFLAFLCSRIESFISNQDSNVQLTLMDKWLDGVFSIQSMIDVILFHHWELEESVFGRLTSTRPKSSHDSETVVSPEIIDVHIKRLSDPGLSLLELIPIEEQVHQLPNNPWEESLELTVPFLSLLSQLDILFGEDRSRNFLEKASFYNNVYRSPTYNPCLTMLRILASGFDTVDVNTLHMVKSHFTIFFDRHNWFIPSKSSQLSKYACPFTSSLMSYIPVLFGCLHEAFLAIYPSLECSDSQSNPHPLVTIYQYLIDVCWDALPELTHIPEDVLRDFWEKIGGDNGTFVHLAISSFWVDICQKFFFPAAKRTVEEGFSRFSQCANNFSQGVNSLIIKVRRETSENLKDEDRFRNIIQNAISNHISYETKRIAGVEVEQKAGLSRMNRLWLVKLQELSREHSVWELPSDLPTYWKLDFLENYSRMRRRLTFNHEFTLHQQASAKRDKTTIQPVDPPTWKVPYKRSSVNHYLSRVGSRAERIKERLSHLEHPTSSNPNDIDSLLSVDSSEDSEWNLVINEDMLTGPTVESPKEKVICEVDCCLIFLLATIQGRLRLTQNHMTFLIDRQRILEEINTPYSTATIDWDMVRDHRWKLSDLREVHFRQHMLRKSALEFFLTDRRGLFFNFPSISDRQRIHSQLAAMSLPNLVGSYASAPADMLHRSNLTQRWQRHEISNFDYLMQLNSIAGRSYNDLTQYFVFPWILVDYESDILDLDDPAVYRDLSKPVGALDPTRLRKCVERYDEFEDPTGRVKKFHYGTHYSSAGLVTFYLLRLEPFTSIHIALQSGRFDHADRQFRSIQSCWQSSLKGLGDVKELIPEFFYLPEFLKNSNRFDLGRTQGGHVVDDVILPPWADSPEHFIRLHREALESEYVSQNLHHWIDLIFGYKQTGEQAIKAHNTFYYLSYEGAVDLDTISDPIERRSIEEQIFHFGQTPSQLLTSPHPQKLPRPVDSIPPHIYSYDPYRWRIGPEGYRTYLLKLPLRNLVFLSVCCLNKDAASHTPSNNYYILSVDVAGTLGYHRLLVNSSQRNDSDDQPPFTMDANYGLQELHRVSSPFAHHARISPKSFVVSPDGQYIISTGHWDNTFKVVQTSTGRIMSSIGGHGDLVMCCALSEDSKVFVSGSRSSNVFSWSLENATPTSTISAQVLATKGHSRLRSISHDGGKGSRSSSGFRHNGSYEHFSQKNYLMAFYGHNDAVICLAVNVEHDILASGSKDGTCIIHSLRHGLYLRSLIPHGATQSFSTNTAVIQNILITSEALVIVCSELQNIHYLHVYTINGVLLHSIELDHMINDIKVSPDQHFVFVVNNAAQVLVYHIFSMEQVLALDLPLVAQCIWFDPRLQIFILGCSDGKLLVIDLHLLTPSA